MLVDSHCHLDFPELAADSDAVVARAKAAGIGVMVTISTQLSRFDGVRAIAERFPNVFCSVGVHPHEAEAEAGTTTAALVARAAHPKVVGIGETGLDFHYEHSPRGVQERLFRAHIAASRETGLPVIVHSRDADAETAAILADEMGQGAFSGLIHCFSSGPELLGAALELGLYISLSGIVTFKNAEALRQTVRAVPHDRLLVETDAPFLAPVPKRGKPNEPSFLAHTAAYLADMLALTPEELAARTTRNFFTLFRKVPEFS
jgi:TatD DNase family protein